MGCLFRKAGRHRAAVKLFRDAIDEGMEEAKCHFNLASSLSALGGDTEEAIRHFERAAELASRKTGHEKGHALFGAGVAATNHQNAESLGVIHSQARSRHAPEGPPLKI